MIGDDGWVNQKMMLAGGTNIGNVLIPVHGTGP
jgi:hypothetical protein